MLRAFWLLTRCSTSTYQTLTTNTTSFLGCQELVVTIKAANTSKRCLQRSALCIKSCKKQLDVNVNLPHMFTKPRLNKLFVSQQRLLDELFMVVWTANHSQLARPLTLLLPFSTRGAHRAASAAKLDRAAGWIRLHTEIPVVSQSRAHV